MSTSDPTQVDTPTLLKSLARDVAEARKGMIEAHGWLGEAAVTLHELTERENRAWRPISSAPRDGSHFLACKAGTTFGWWDGKPAPPFQTVVHWWGNPGEEGFYTSVNETEPQHPFEATHWKPLDAPDAGGLGRTVAAMVRETDAAVDAILRGDAS